jgi:DMSO/TMAO reductase YedYZ molybdopterin-dependent catalytic subunit
MAQKSLIPRTFDSGGRLQMAETPLEEFDEQGRPEELFLVHHYDRPGLSADHAITVVAPDGAEQVHSISSLAQLPPHEVVALLECAGNGRGLLRHEAPGNQFGLGMFGQARWTGVRLADVLSASGAAGAWTSAVIEAPDNGVTKPENVHAQFGKGLPRSKALDGDTILALKMNGRPLTAEHGAPCRLVVPGWYGIWWVKWIATVHLTSEDYTGFWQNERYTYQDVDSTITGVVRELLPRAVIQWPREGDRLPDPVTVRGLAWGGADPAAGVDISVDDGNTWIPATITASRGRWSAAGFTCSIPAGLPRGLRRISARTTDGAGHVQPWQARYNRLGYANNGIHTVTIDLTAD